MGRVVHCKREVFDVYIGRPSILGNPWRIVGEAGRAEAIKLFEGYARDRMAKDGIFRARVAACHGKTLGCWCAPKACHGDVLLKLAAELQDIPEGRGPLPAGALDRVSPHNSSTGANPECADSGGAAADWSAVNPDRYLERQGP